jgi:hypothetical protein
MISTRGNPPKILVKCIIQKTKSKGLSFVAKISELWRRNSIMMLANKHNQSIKQRV